MKSHKIFQYTIIIFYYFLIANKERNSSKNKQIPFEINDSHNSKLVDETFLIHLGVKHGIKKNSYIHMVVLN